jgi:predicted RNA binding protein YcfA (HicA-like mRNA interferase family)
MGRLSGFTYGDVARKLRKLGFHFERQAAGSHEVWRHDDRRKATLVRHTGSMKEGTLRAILREASIDVEEFLNA